MPLTFYLGRVSGAGPPGLREAERRRGPGRIKSAERGPEREARHRRQVKQERVVALAPYQEN